ncbi:MAG: glycosyltransferase [Phycisphaerales bacterium]
MVSVETRTIIIVPCYNEADRLDAAAFTTFAQAHSNIAFHFVDDGSSDQTAAMLRELCEALPDQLSWQSLDRNRGKAEAVRQGIVHALDRNPDAVGFWDADLATPLEDIPLFIQLLEDRPGLQAVFGSRVNLLGRHVHRALLRHYIGRLFATAATMVLHTPIYDTQCGAKLFRASDHSRSVFATPFVSSWIFDVEVIARLLLRMHEHGVSDPGEVIFEQPLMVWRDVAGSKLKLRHFLTVAIDLVRIWMKYPHRKKQRAAQRADA